VADVIQDKRLHNPRSYNYSCKQLLLRNLFGEACWGRTKTLANMVLCCLASYYWQLLHNDCVLLWPHWLKLLYK